MIQACLNGSRVRGSHPALPLTPEQIAQSARECVQVGARTLHLHPRNAEGQQALDGKVVGAAVQALRQVLPDIPIGVSTIATIASDFSERVKLIEGWEAKPDFASLNLCEEGWLEVGKTLLRIGVEIEAGVWSEADAIRLVESPLAEQCLRVLLEPQETSLEIALANLGAIERVLDEAALRAPRLLHGLEATTWPLIETALQRGYDTRIGFEDTFYLPDGTLARSNAELVLEARKLWSRTQ